MISDRRWYVAYGDGRCVLRAKDDAGLAEWRSRDWRMFEHEPSIVEVTGSVRRTLLPLVSAASSSPGFPQGVGGGPIYFDAAAVAVAPTPTDARAIPTKGGFRSFVNDLQYCGALSLRPRWERAGAPIELEELVWPDNAGGWVWPAGFPTVIEPPTGGKVRGREWIAILYGYGRTARRALNPARAVGDKVLLMPPDPDDWPPIISWNDDAAAALLEEHQRAS